MKFLTLLALTTASSLTAASPTPRHKTPTQPLWSEALMEEINNLRAAGVSEKAIAEQYSRLQPPSYNRPVFQAATFPASSEPTLDSPTFYIQYEPERQHCRVHTLAQTILRALGLASKPHSRHRNAVLVAATDMPGSPEDTLPFNLLSSPAGDYYLEPIPSEDSTRYNAKARLRLHEGVGNRGEEFTIQN